MADVASSTTARISRLTPRERECLRLVGRGFSSKEIGRQLAISPASVVISILLDEAPAKTAREARS